MSSKFPGWYNADKELIKLINSKFCLRAQPDYDFKEGIKMGFLTKDDLNIVPAKYKKTFNDLYDKFFAYLTIEMDFQKNIYEEYLFNTIEVDTLDNINFELASLVKNFNNSHDLTVRESFLEYLGVELPKKKKGVTIYAK